MNARGIAITVGVTFLVVVLLAATFVYSGLYNVSALGSDSGLVASALSTIADRSIDTHARGAVGPALDSLAVSEGADHFHEMCVVCHGAPGVPKGEIGEGLNPSAPELSKLAAGELSEGQIYWVIRNGIRFTGMPAFEASHSDEQMWAIAKFVKSLEGMTAAQYEAIFRAKMAGARADSGARSPHAH